MELDGTLAEITQNLHFGVLPHRPGGYQWCVPDQSVLLSFDSMVKIEKTPLDWLENLRLSYPTNAQALIWFGAIQLKLWDTPEITLLKLGENLDPLIRGCFDLSDLGFFYRLNPAVRNRSTLKNYLRPNHPLLIRLQSGEENTQ